MNRYIEKFISYIEIEKNYSPHTLLNYRIDLEEFAKFANVDVEKVDYLLLRRYLAQLKTMNVYVENINVLNIVALSVKNVGWKSPWRKCDASGWAILNWQVLLRISGS